MTVDQVDQTAFAREWALWHDDREKRRASPHGFLSITGLHWLSDRPARFSDAPGEWSTSDAGVRVVLAEGETLVVNGKTVRGTHDFGVIEDGARVNAAFDDAVVEVARRGDRDMIRPRHPDQRLVLDFKGTPAFAPDLRWVLPGRFVAFVAPRRVAVGSVIEGLETEYEALGEVEFVLEGAAHRLTVFSESGTNELLILFSDATSGVSTFGTRELEVNPPDEAGYVTLDFNRATNQPCAYTEFSTCPLPPPENRLATAIEAGEKTPYEQLGD